MVLAKHPLLDALERTPRDGCRRDLVKGRIIEMPPAWPRSSRAGVVLTFYLELFCREHRLPYTVFGADAGLTIAEPAAPGLPPTVVSPDASVVANAKLPPGDPPGFWSVVPDIAVEVLSPSDPWRDVQDKIDAYLEAGVPLLWIVDARSQSVSVYAPGQPTRTLRHQDDVLDGGAVWPDFRLRLRDIFERPS